MDCTEAIVNNSSVKTVRKLQVLLSLHDENTAIKERNKQRFLNLLNASINGYIHHGGRDYTVHSKQRKKTSNELSVNKGKCVGKMMDSLS